MARTDDPHRRGAAVLLVVGVEDEQHVHRPLEHRIELVPVADLPHHLQEVARVRQAVVRVVERQPDREAVAHRGDRRRLGDQPQDLLLAGLLVEDLLRVVVERPERRDCRHEHAHRVGVVVEPVDEPLAHVLVDVRVVRDVGRPLLELRLVGQLALQQQVRDLEVGRLLGQLLDRVPAVAQDACVAVEVGDRRLAGCGLHVGRVVDEQVGVELTNRRRRKDAVGDRCGDGLTGPIVGDGDGLGHVASSVSRAMVGAGLSPRAANVPAGRLTAPTLTFRSRALRAARVRTRSTPSTSTPAIAASAR